jgi:hypothetical protein
VLAIDPGNVQSAFVLYDGEIKSSAIIANDALVEGIKNLESPFTLAIEMIASYGMPVGKEVFDTCVWIGRFVQANYEAHHLEAENTLIYRKDVKMHFCQSMRAKDSNIRQALLDRFGGKDTAIGTKKAPGPLYGVKADAWSALAVALYYQDTRTK